MADGVLDSANQTLMENGLIDTPMTWDTYEAVMDDILSLGDKTLAAGRRKMVRTIWEQAPQFKASQLDIALYLAATRTDHDLEAALRLMQSFSPDFIVGWLKKLTDSDAQQKIHDELVYQTANSEDMASVRALKENLGQIRLFVSSVGQYAEAWLRPLTVAHAAKPEALSWPAAHPPCMTVCSSSRTAPTSLAAASCSSTTRAFLSSPVRWTRPAPRPADCGGRDDQPPRRLHQLCRCTRGCVQPGEVPLQDRRDARRNGSGGDGGRQRFGGQLLPPPVAPPAGPVRALNRQDHASRPRPGAKKAPGRGLCLCSILKFWAVDLWQFTKIERPLDKYIGGGG